MPFAATRRLRSTTAAMRCSRQFRIFRGHRCSGACSALVSVGFPMWTASGVAVAMPGRPRAGAHRLERLQGLVLTGVVFGLGAALGQAKGSLIARPIMAAGMDPYLASLFRVGASGVAMGAVALTALAPIPPQPMSRHLLILTAITAITELLIGMTLFLFAVQGGKTGIIAMLSATSPVIILPLLWLRTGQRPTGMNLLGGAMAVLGSTLIFLR